VVWKHVPNEPSADFTPHFPSTVGDFATPALNPKELTLIVYTLPFHRAPYSGVNSWLLEIIPENRAMINPEDARKRDIEQGQEIEIKSVDSMITLRTRAQVAPGVRPGVIAIASGFGYDQYGANDQIIDQRLITGRKERAAGVNPSELAGKAVLVTRVWGSLCR
jgi:anaerobic selenocysteine-containing dehydrogenase